MRPLRKLYVPVTLLGLFGLLAVVWFTLPKGVDAGSDALRKAVLAENWKGVIDLCAAEEDTPMPVHLRVLKGHACLALNLNDESLSHFLSIANDGDRLTWNEWTIQFAETNPQNAVAVYLTGDGLARLGRWKEAEASYSEALSQARTYIGKAMILNARGVARVYMDNSKGAIEDFEMACASAPDLADAHANLGTFLVLVAAPEGAVAHYDEALVNAKNTFALAHNGLGCARLGYSRDPSTVAKALTDFQVALKCPQTRDLTQSNIQQIVDHCLAEVGADQADASPGATVMTENLHFRDIGGMNGKTIDGIGAQMTPQQFKQFTNEYHTHQRNIDLGKTWLTGLDRIGISFKNNKLFVGAEASGPRFEQHLSIREGMNSNAYDSLIRGYNNAHKGPGGADTIDVAVERSSGDTGPWLAKNTWFGLVPATELPEVTPPGF